ncbi:MAG: 50S ribosomal protein L33 [Candidatus Woesebacteria bacterium GW2011_GWB1_43_14]|uniref:Large ribosomal subunit protein bL33 n=1 Tax=Candidatus Woesebacteria bacterium GW2011_GWB1_43_14 TaxID=1618578 RepID=A0A0G1GDH4_9BACT|nr:MAG: 50S ribosomal protein L33 [Candidatus Woesebacteria bacterium GW2011_GWB1_43_14]
MVEHFLGKKGVGGSNPLSGSGIIPIMAKGSREVVAMKCRDCKAQNYITTRNKVNIEGKLVVKKYCRNCRKITEHKETIKLK